MATPTDQPSLLPSPFSDLKTDNESPLTAGLSFPPHRHFYSPRKLFNTLKQHGLSRILLLVLLISLPFAIFATYQEVRERSRGMENPVTPPITSPITPPISPPPATADIDAQTGEYYDLWFDAQVKLVEREGSGPLYGAQVDLYLGGPRLQSYGNLIAIKQSSESPYAENETIFVLDNFQYRWNRFKGSFVTYGSGNNCLDFYHQTGAAPQYVATMCYTFSPTTPGERQTIGAPSYNPFVEFDYAGSQPSLIFTMSTAFNKFSKPVGSQDGPLMTRVNFFTIDSDTSSLSDYHNVNYIIQGIVEGLDESQYASLCFNPTDPQKYFKFTPDSRPKPEGGSNEEVDGPEGSCGYRMQSHYFRPFFVSLYVDGGVPTPYPTGLPTPTTLPTATPEPEPTDSPTPTPEDITPTASPTQTPTPTVIPTPTPTPPPNNLGPQLITARLKNAIIGTPYSATIRGFDLDSNNISIKASGLPRGLRLNRCSHKKVLFGSTVTCTLSGTPRSSSRNYSVVFTLTDNEGGISQKTLTLRVRQAH